MGHWTSGTRIVTFHFTIQKKETLIHRLRWQIPLLLQKKNLKSEKSEKKCSRLGSETKKKYKKKKTKERNRKRYLTKKYKKNKKQKSFSYSQLYSTRAHFLLQVFTTFFIFLTTSAWTSIIIFHFIAFHFWFLFACSTQ